MLTLLIGMHFVVFSSMGWNLEFFPGDAGDARFNNYILEHGYRYISGVEPGFWGARFLFPEGGVITYSDNLLGTMPIYAVFRWLGAERETAFQGWVLALFALNFLCSYGVLNWLSKNRYAAALGAFVFTFSIALQSQMAHAQMFPRFFIPLAIWAGLLFYESLKTKHFFWMLMAIVGQFYAGIYLGFMLLVPMFILFLFILFSRRRKLAEHFRDRKWAAQALAGFGVAMLLMWLLMEPYISGMDRFKDLDYAFVVDSIPTVKSFFYAPKGTFWTMFEETGKYYPEFWNHQIFPGGMALLAMLLFPVILFLKWKKGTLNKKLVFLSVAGAFTFLVFIRYSGTSIYQWFFELPGFNSMRSMTRVINVELLFFAVAVTLLFSEISNRWKSRQWLVLLVLPLLVLDNHIDPLWTVRTKKTNVQMARKKLEQRMAYIPENSVVSYEPDSLVAPVNYYHLDMMIAAQDLNLRTINGYTARLPETYIPYARSLTEETRKKWLESRGLNPKVYVIK